MQKILRDEIGVEESLLNLLREFHVVTAKLQGQLKCTGAFAAYAQIRVAQGPWERVAPRRLAADRRHRARAEVPMVGQEATRWLR